MNPHDRVDSPLPTLVPLAAAAHGMAPALTRSEAPASNPDAPAPIP